MVTSRRLLDRSRCCTMDTKTIPLQAECRDEAVKYEAFLTGQFASICSSSWMARQLTWSYCLTTSGTPYSFFCRYAWVCLWGGWWIHRTLILVRKTFNWSSEPTARCHSLNLWRGITIQWALFAGFLADLPWIPMGSHHFSGFNQPWKNLAGLALGPQT